MLLSEETIAAAYEWAVAWIESQSPPSLARDRAIDAATDALMWAIDNYRPVNGSFIALYQSGLRTFLMRVDYRQRAKIARRKAVEFNNSSRIARFNNAEGTLVRIEVRNDWVDPKTERHPLAPTVRDLAPDLARVAHLYAVGGLTLREIAAWRGGSPNTVMLLLDKAARELATPGAQERSVKKRGKKRTAG